MIKTKCIRFITGLILGSMMLNGPVAYAAEAPVIARTRAWDAIEYTLGGPPESVMKIEYAGSVFYLGKDVTESDFLAVLEAGPEAVGMKATKDSGKLYNHPAYILWNSDKTVLLVHPIVFKMDDILEPVAVPTDPPASLLEAKAESKPVIVVLTADQEYMLSEEYTEAVREEFYRLLNEHRKANGLRELEVNLELQAYADIRADEQRISFGHTRPDGTAAGSGWYNSENYLTTRYAENAMTAGAVGLKPEGTALGMFSRWKASEGHNRHMLYDFDSHITMAFGFKPALDDDGYVISGGIFATGY